MSENASDHSKFQALFDEHERDVRLRNTRNMAIFAAVGMMIGSLLDIAVYPAHFWEFFLIRVASALLLLLIYVGVPKIKRESVRHFVLEFVAFVPLGAILWMIDATQGVHSTYYAGLNIVFVGMSATLWWPWRSLFMLSIFNVVSYLIVCFSQPGEMDWRLLTNNLYFMILTSAFVGVGGHFYLRSRFKEFMLNRELNEATKQLEANHIELQGLDEAKTRFFANISHELRTPLTVILGTVEGLQEKKPARDSAREAEMLDSVRNNGLRLLGLINNLLDLVKLDQAGMKVLSDPTRASVLLRGLVKSVQTLAEQKSIHLDYAEKEELPVLLLDVEKIEKIVFNLLINAIKFTDAGGCIHVRAAYEGGRLKFSVKDNGIGMDGEKVRNIFKRFWQADSSMQRKFRGSGIGLALTKDLVDVMEGDISVESEERKGSTFFVELPAEISEQAAVSEEAEILGPVERIHRSAQLIADVADESQRFVSEGVLPELNDKNSDTLTVLVADDEPDIRTFLASTLEDAYTVIEAIDGQEALSSINQLRPDIVLLDYMMPSKTGLEVCHELRADTRFSGLPIVMLTARADDQIKMECLRAGANDYLSKPCSMAELRLRVDAQARVIRFQRQLREQNHQLEQSFRELQEKDVELLRHEKLASLGRMSAGIIHEINNPLNYVGTSLHMLSLHERSLPPDEIDDFRDSLSDAKEGIERVVQIVTDLRAFTKSETQSMAHVSLLEVVEGAERFVADQLTRGIVCQLDIARDITVYGNGSQLMQVFMNFFQNSCDAIRERQQSEPEHQGEITVSARRMAGADTVTLFFHDNGCGIPAETRDKVFDPFFSSKQEGEGMGLGLSIVYQIFERHGIHVQLDSTENEQTCFQLAMPVSSN